LDHIQKHVVSLTSCCKTSADRRLKQYMQKYKFAKESQSSDASCIWYKTLEIWRSLAIINTKYQLAGINDSTKLGQLSRQLNGCWQNAECRHKQLWL